MCIRDSYSRRFKDTDIFEKIFVHILQEAIECGFIDESVLFIDSTHIKANANKKKKIKKAVPIQAKQYKEQLDKDCLLYTSSIAALLDTAENPDYSSWYPVPHAVHKSR